jgi:hypothetical protein
MKTAGLSHVILTVSDIARSRALQHLLGQINDLPEYNISVRCGRASIKFLPSRSRRATLCEFRVGLDHLALRARWKPCEQRTS